MKQTLKIGVMLLVVATLATAGIALAQSDDSPAVFADPDEAAADETTLRSRLVERMLAWLSPLVEDGTIDEDQAAAVAGLLADRLPRPPPGVVRGLAVLQEAADFLEMTGRELVAALREGATLADLAGEAARALADHLVGLAQAHLDQAVADGRLTEEEAAERLAEATERLTDLMNGELDWPWLEDGFHGPGPGGGGRFGPGHGDGPCRGGDDTGADTGLTDLGA